MELTALAHAHLASAAVLAVGLVALCVPFIGVGILALRSTGSVVRSVIRRL
jgi:site-specific recombinase